MSSADHDWQWREGTVARAKPHFELRYGSSNDADWSSWPTVALVGQPRNAVFPVQFLINERDRVDRPKMIEGARRERLLSD